MSEVFLLDGIGFTTADTERFGNSSHGKESRRFKCR
jgi:hypothetical protein